LTYKLDRLRDELQGLKKSKDSKKIQKCFGKIKTEIENSCSIKLNTKDGLKHVQNEFKKKKINLTKEEWRKICNKFGNVSRTIQEKENEKELPVMLEWSITCVLVGFFLTLTKIPPLVNIGTGMMTAGLGMAFPIVADKEQERRDEKNKPK
jgi:hypothetical protein